MKKFVSTLIFLNVLVILGLVGFLYATGRLDREKTLTILDLLKHPQTPTGLREHTHEVLTKGIPGEALTQPATRPGDGDVHPAPLKGTALEKLEAARASLEAERLKLENEARELQHRQQLLTNIQADVEAKLAQIKAERQAYEKHIAETAGKTADEAFQRSLTLYNEMKPKQVKDVFLTFAPGTATDLVAKYLLAMEPERAGKVIAEFKTDAEKQFIAGVLEKIRTAAPEIRLSKASS